LSRAAHCNPHQFLHPILSAGGGKRQHKGTPAGEDLLRLAEIVVQLNNPANARRLAALTWGAYRTPDDENRAGVIFGFVRFYRLMRAAACADLSTAQDSIPAGFRM
jgi:hypothetical protein